jgi:hypothetical protein
MCNDPESWGGLVSGGEHQYWCHHNGSFTAESTTLRDVRQHVRSFSWYFVSNFIGCVGKPLDLDLNSRPSILPSNLVPSKLLLSISVSNICVDIVVIQHPALDRIVVDTLSTRSVDVAVRLENNSTATLRARLSCGVDLEQIVSRALTYSNTSFPETYKPARRTPRPAHLNLILRTRSRT